MNLKALFLILIFTVLGVCNVEARTSDKVWILKQIVNDGGKRTVCVSNSGIKFVQNEYVLFSKAPEWKITVLNKKLKNYYETSMVGINGVSWIEKIPGPVEKGLGAESKIAGLNTNVFKSTPKALHKITVKTTSEVPVAGEKLELIQTLYGSSTVDGLPLEVTVTDKKNKSKNLLFTDWYLSKELPNSFYNVPRGYIAAKTLSEVQIPNSKGKKRVRKYRSFQK